MYIYPSSPESASSLQSEESAAVKIQAGFRGYRVRKQLYRSNKPVNTNRISGNTLSSQRFSSGRRQQHSQSSQLTRTHSNILMEERRNIQKTAVDGQQVPAASADVASIEDRCATKIQAGFRGFLVRKKQKIATDAAVKIQSSFRGFKARKEAEKLKHS
ncbi:LOW QUALITY PROTEIN: abnormal spindle-like microcephaly-associated protein homolog [Drosophila sulfurigaster albostrigata]|uniref:LOW QUALITY PROTEIN: abnormal spindle-like microcephaly-associated protein homolog n=1 Tax=Drosophila sulfurigaster albostrigata TaxID=89887 RepID=UPI002D21B15B|nr:LOW QUALITY PROTEIN: abnormal spindle-like microcephaly-associated protein homolog [Drosophila sulfurigaster albostrigata]